jgi:hypothetical protein
MHATGRTAKAPQSLQEKRACRKNGPCFAARFFKCLDDRSGFSYEEDSPAMSHACFCSRAQK